MKFEEFKAGIFKEQYQYKSFQPATINDEWKRENARINVLLETATRTLGELKTLFNHTPL